MCVSMKNIYSMLLSKKSSLMLIQPSHLCHKNTYLCICEYILYIHICACHVYNVLEWHP